jgi:bacteriocin biosynthesis cyclodehydratase domain-containing protein
VSDAARRTALDALLADRNRRFPNRPRLVADVRVFRMPDGLGVQFHAGDSPTILRGVEVDRIVGFLLDRLDGGHTLEQILDAYPRDAPVGALVKALMLLHTRGALADGTDLEPAVATDATLRRQLLFWGRHVGLSRSAPHGVEVQRRLAGTRCAVVGTGAFGSLTIDLLSRSGLTDLRVVAWDDDGYLVDSLAALPGPPTSVTAPATTDVAAVEAEVRLWIDNVDLIVTSTRNAPTWLFEAVNAMSLHAHVPWLRADETPSGFEIGPYVDPWSSACFTCMVLRRRSMQPYPIEEHLVQQDLAAARPAGTTRPQGESLAAASLAAGIVVGEVVRVVTHVAPPSLLTAVLHVAPVAGPFERNAVLRVPRCEACYPGRELPSHA